jgi:uncharacterized repeat protein (TIGR04138 family)
MTKLAMPTTQLGIAEILRRDARYPAEAYEFVFEALFHTQKKLRRARQDAPKDADPDERHVTGQELAHGIAEYALAQFGFLARTVFKRWNIHSTADFGEIVFNLIEANQMSKTAHDRREDFHDVFDLDEALSSGFRIQAEDYA